MSNNHPTIEKSLLVCVIVGLPARGKTSIAQKLCRYLDWIGYETKVINVGQYRRRIAGAQRTHEFFDTSNEEANRLRKQAAHEALDDMVYWLKDMLPRKISLLSLDSISAGIPNAVRKVAIYDATNSTLSRREDIRKMCGNLPILFIESICNNDALIMENILQVKVSSPDYMKIEPEKAAQDFKERIGHYEKTYQPLNFDGICEKSASFVKLIDVGTQVIINQVHDHLQSRIVYYLMNIHIHRRTIFMCRVIFIFITAWRINV
jgi:6-phosphofructo-2-kinase/fructose-2,6-biphosphatase 2